jgi:hypothetical protein
VARSPSYGSTRELPESISSLAALVQSQGAPGAAPIEESHRIFQCRRCGKQVRICTRCDRGQRYCSDACRTISRRGAIRAASRRYQETPQGAENHRRREKRYRISITGRVTHQGSPPLLTVASQAAILVAAYAAKREGAREDYPECDCCDFCGRPCGSFSRFFFIHTGGYG